MPAGAVPKWRRVLSAAGAFLVLGMPAVASAELVIEGLSGRPLANARAYVALSDEACDAPQWLLRRRFRELDDEIRKAIRPFGFYSPKIEKQLSAGDECWQATVSVQPGPLTHLRQVDIRIAGEAASDPEFGEAAAKGRPEPGAPLNQAVYTDYKESLQTLAAERGYVEAQFTAARVDVWPEKQIADITLHFDSGPRYDLGEVVVEQDFLRSGLVEAYLDLEPGTPYDAELISDAYRALLESGFFREVRIEPDLSVAADRRIPVHVYLTRAKRIEYSVGLGVSTDSGLRLRGGYQNTRVNRRGHRWGADALISDVESSLSANYRLPLRDPTVEWLVYTAGVRQQDTETSESTSITGRVQRVRRLRADWLRTEAVQFGYWDYTVGTDDDDSRLIVPSLAFTRTRIAESRNPRRGHSLGIESRATHRAIGSTTSFLQFTGYARLMHPLGGRGKVILGTELGITIKSEIDELPPEYRFFAGGDASVRGYGYQALGPTDADGNVIGGSRLATLRFEYVHDLFGNFAGAVFVDAGNAFDALKWSPAVGAGLGLRWRSPVGPLRIYLAHPFDDPDTNVRLHVSLGPDL